MPLCRSVPAFTGTSETRPKMLTGPPSLPLHTQPLLPVSRSLLPCWGRAAVAGLCFPIGSVLCCFPGGSSGKEPTADAGDVRVAGSIPGLGSSPGEGHGNPLQYCGLENPMDRGAWRATVHGAAKSQARLKLLSMHAFVAEHLKALHSMPVWSWDRMGVNGAC